MIIVRNTVKDTMYPVQIDYDLSLKDMVEAGNYNRVDPDILNFSVIGKGKREIHLQLLMIIDSCGHTGVIQFPVPRQGNASSDEGIVVINAEKGVIYSEEVFACMDSVGLRPAKVEEMLAFGARYPTVQLQHLVICLGSTWNDLVPYLTCNCEYRCVDLSSMLKTGWGNAQFLVVKKTQS